MCFVLHVCRATKVCVHYWQMRQDKPQAQSKKKKKENSLRKKSSHEEEEEEGGSRRKKKKNEWVCCDSGSHTRTIITIHQDNE